ncbi:FmdB family zinc ribbon protein [Thermosulfurimonas dismutans]|uniref:Type I antifreeze protein n=1 Tax=Thermosulfurimonas dismutans TaxID=999894 RepID=A0A179D626_9BACT|nr:FmdB family zinc ribbon protein [Thermosulfurimonas dismutans]OAQ21555.1 Type I antifreeze protein [Thermosulfurimonas dismutans]
MPVYEYECEACGKHLEVWQKITDAPLTKCEACGGKLRKLISQSSFILKGSGWYVTDYARKERKDSSKETSKGGSESKDKA